MAIRVTQVLPKVLSEGDPKARVTQVLPKVLAQGDPRARFTQVVAKVLSLTRDDSMSVACQPNVSFGANTGLLGQVAVSLAPIVQFIPDGNVLPISVAPNVQFTGTLPTQLAYMDVSVAPNVVFAPKLTIAAAMAIGGHCIVLFVATLGGVHSICAISDNFPFPETPPATRDRNECY